MRSGLVPRRDDATTSPSVALVRASTASLTDHCGSVLHLGRLAGAWRLAARQPMVSAGSLPGRPNCDLIVSANNL